MSRAYVRIADGVYVTKIGNVNVRIVRRKCGRHPIYHTWSNQPTWIAKIDDVYAARTLGITNGRILSDGNGTRDGAADNADRFLASRIKP